MISPESLSTNEQKSITVLKCICFLIVMTKVVAIETYSTEAAVVEMKLMQLVREELDGVGKRDKMSKFVDWIGQAYSFVNNN